ncbi:MAG: hypothetical protein HQ561_02475 [Desulfobacteraceae bacterium]|nr:hypothetical protein [Desulfobacteraceae bacterium]
MKIVTGTMAMMLFFISLIIEFPRAFAVEEGVEKLKVQEKDKLSASADVGVFSQYIWRGWELSKDSVVIQPSATLGYKGFSINVWGNWDTHQYGLDKSSWNETDLTLSYERSFGPINLSGGWVYYALNSFDDQQEFFFIIEGDVMLAPTFSVYKDITKVDSWYFNLGISHSFELPMDMNLDLAASAGYYVINSRYVVTAAGDEKVGDNYSAFHDGVVSASLNIPFAKYFTCTPMIAYSFPLSSDAKNLLKSDSLSNKAAHLFGGITFSVAF